MNFRRLIRRAQSLYGRCDRSSLREMMIEEGKTSVNASKSIHTAIKNGYIVLAKDGSISYKDDVKRQIKPVTKSVAVPTNLVSDVEEIVYFLNQRTGSKFEAKGSNADMIKARLKTHKKTDLINVIEFKAKEWMGTTMEKYLRPATLFNKTKFEQYIGQVEMRLINTKEDMIMSYSFEGFLDE